jgi:hypothetical protein
LHGEPNIHTDVNIVTVTDTNGVSEEVVNILQIHFHGCVEHKRHPIRRRRIPLVVGSSDGSSSGLDLICFLGPLG